MSSKIVPNSKQPAKPKGKNPSKPAKQSTNTVLPPKQERMIQEYISPKSEGYGNKSRSAELAGYTPAYGRSLFVQHSTIKNRIAELYDEAGAGHQVRSRRLSEILSGSYRHTTESESSGVNGNGIPITMKTKTTRNPTANEVIKAIDIGNRADGTYDQQAAVADAIGADLKALYKAQRKQVLSNKD